MAENRQPLGPVDLAFLFAFKREVRTELLDALRQIFAGADGTADDYVLAGPGEGE